MPELAASSDAEVEEVRSAIYQLADIAVEAYRQSAGFYLSLHDPDPPEPEPEPEENLKYEFEERAAIHQFEGNAQKSVSERLTREEFGPELN